jgi:hypothetical protein
MKPMMIRAAGRPTICDRSATQPSDRQMLSAVHAMAKHRAIVNFAWTGMYSARRAGGGGGSDAGASTRRMRGDAYEISLDQTYAARLVLQPPTIWRSNALKRIRISITTI